jgi:capsular polysaccharide transport system permease protein
MTQSPPEPLAAPDTREQDPAPAAPTPLPTAAQRAAARGLKAAPPAARPKPVPPARPKPAPVPRAQTELARLRGRHWRLIASFLLLVILPATAATTYLYTRAADQYHSTTAFSIRSEQLSAAAAGILGAITQMGSGTASDISVLFDFIRSQRIVEIIDAKLDLRQMFNRQPDDVYFSLGKDASIEDLLAYWRRMVTVDLSNAGIIQVRVNAFTPEDAHAIAEEILAESGKLINQLSDQAHEDAVKFSREELAMAEGKLRQARQDLADFRRTNHIIDPSGDVQSQVGIVNALQAELAKAMIERDMILTYADSKDQRVVQADRRISAISDRIQAERDGMESGGVEGALPDVVGRYEALRVDLEIVSTAYTHALAGVAASEAEARRQSRYLAPHIQPTMAQKSLYPQRAMLAAMVTVFLALGWSILLLIYYNIRDNNR